MDNNILVKLIGFYATLIHGDPTVLDRWIWLKRRLPLTCGCQKLLDIGCGSGAFTIGLALRGYSALGLSWDKRNQRVARERAQLCKAKNAQFDVYDVRFLDARKDLFGNYDVVISLECIEHIINDQKLMNDMAACLKPGGRLLLTAPNFNYVPIGIGDDKVIAVSKIEDGWHVRIGYTEDDLRRLCKTAGLEVDEISYCVGVLSQKIIFFQRLLCRINPLFAWCVVLPLRPIPPLMDRLVTGVLKWPEYSVCLDAHKP